MKKTLHSTGRFTSELRRLMADSYDNCRSCGAKLSRGIASFAGYNESGVAIYVGECCKHTIAELASHIYWWWEVDKRCAPDQPLWRYMDFSKFVLMLQQRGIYFARADVLGDNFEGAAGIAERRAEWDEFYLQFFRDAVRTVPGRREELPASEIDHQANRLLDQFTKVGEVERKRTFVSCWHANAGESEALWRLYCPPPTAGVAIRTNARLLTEALSSDQRLKIGHVTYVDFRKSFAGTHDRIFWKRMSLSHEAEVRAVIQDHHLESSGFVIPTRLEDLILSVVPSPFAPVWFDSLLNATLQKFEVDLPLSRSDLLSTPFF